MKPFKRVFLIVLDSVGIGEAPDAETFGDKGADTLGHIAEVRGGLYLPELEKLGLGNIREFPGVKSVAKPEAHFGKMQEASSGKDTMTGHWEIMGLHIEEPFQTFPDGFPDELVNELEKATGRRVIGNKPASGTKIIEELGKEHLDTGALIVYTSADPVLQIAAHEDVVPLEELYQICGTAREMTKDAPYKIGRVIARPFEGKPGQFERRNDHRQDYALSPFSRTVMSELQDADYDVIALGKINDIYNGEGITTGEHTDDNADGVEKLLQTMDKSFHGLAFLNLVDFDSKYGHRRDPEGYGDALEAYDRRLPGILAKMNEDDLLMITADHGNDPTFSGTDHTRELVPLLVYHPGIKNAQDLGVRQTFADLSATIAENFQVKKTAYGVSFLRDIVK